jgi:hypothetical protein
LLASTGMALLVNPLWIFGVIATGLVSINVAITSFCPVGTVLRRLGFTPMLGSETSGRWNLCRMQTDKLMLACSAWFSLFTLFVGGAMVWFAGLKAELPESGAARPTASKAHLPSHKSQCLGGHPILARKDLIGPPATPLTSSLPAKTLAVLMRESVNVGGHRKGAEFARDAVPAQ